MSINVGSSSRRRGNGHATESPRFQRRDHFVFASDDANRPGEPRLHLPSVAVKKCRHSGIWHLWPQVHLSLSRTNIQSARLIDGLTCAIDDFVLASQKALLLTVSILITRLMRLCKHFHF